MKRDLNERSDDGTVDLHPANWSSERPKQREPFWGKDWRGGLAWLIGFAVMMTAVHYFR